MSNAASANPAPSVPYRATPVFTEQTLPPALQREHRTKAGVWGVLTVLDGAIRFVCEITQDETLVTPGHPRLIEPQAPHHVVLVGPVAMRVDFYDHQPVGMGF